MAVAVAGLLVTGCGGGTGGSAATGGGSAGGSAETPVPGGTLRVGEYSEAINLNPFEAVDTPSEQVFMQIIETLYQTAPDGKVEPVLAESAKPSDDYRKWTVQLRKGVKFSDGRPLTAEDVVFSLDKIIKSAGWSSMYEAISDVRAAGPTSVEVLTKQPFPGLVGVLALPFAGIVEKNYGGMSAKEFATHPVGTGPFVLESWQHGKAITLAKNPTYWQQGKPYLEKIVVTAPASDEARVLQLKGEQVDLIAGPPTSQVAGLESTPGIRVEKSPNDLAYYLVLNMKNPLFENPKVREAIDLAVDRQAYVKAAENGVGEVAGSWMPSVVDYWDESIKVPERDPAKAKALVAEAVKEGVDPNVSLMIAAGDATSNIGSQIIQENLEEIGIKVTISPIDSSAKIEAELEGDFEMTIEGVSTDIVDPSEMAGLYIGLNAFFTQGSNATMEKLLGKAAIEPDKAKVAQLYQEMQEYVAEEKELISLSYKPWVWGVREDVVGFRLSAVGLPIFMNAGFGR
ncbi:MAG: ABC transporter substrate-binding protein [Actinobacteria bacterium]|nr:ABC transporter substrate-binding protein [Actinomycetota bacterium]